MFDSLTIYCLATGKPIASIADDEVGVIIDSMTHLPVAEQAPHLERLALLSMRPSLLWMNVTAVSLESIRYAAPRQLLAYLLNRLYAPTRLKDTPDDMLATRRKRIAIWQHIESCNIANDQLDSLLLVLLLIDSKYGLTKIKPPVKLVDLSDSWSEDGASELILNLWDWQNALARKAADDAKRAKFQEAFWSEGNRHARNAASNLFQKVQPKATEEQKVAKTLRDQKAARTRMTVSFLDELERELTVRPATKSDVVESITTAPTLPTPSVPKKPIMRFGKKEA